MGDPTTEAGKALLKERSPLWKAGDIKAPLLIGQGANGARALRGGHAPAAGVNSSP
jgi:hypothetical protein